MITDAFVTVECSNCDETADIGLETVYRDYSGKTPMADLSEAALDKALAAYSWLYVDESEHLCPDCAEIDNEDDDDYDEKEGDEE